MLQKIISPTDNQLIDAEKRPISVLIENDAFFQIRMQLRQNAPKKLLLDNSFMMTKLITPTKYDDVHTKSLKVQIKT